MVPQINQPKPNPLKVFRAYSGYIYISYEGSTVSTLQKSFL